MKKLYKTPETDVIMTESAELICISTPIGGDGNGPACIPLLDDDTEM